MKRKAVSAKLRHKWKTKAFVIVLLLICLCFSTLWLMEAHYARIAASSSSRFSLFDLKPKIAFLFIARNRLPLDLVWHQFFEGGNANCFSIYVHSRPGFLLNKLTTRSTYFLDRQVNNSIQIYWGEASMIQAEIILLQHALMDPSNERFAFLSDSCIPLYNFSYTYDYIMSTSTSFVDSFADKKEGRYNPKMDPVIPAKQWRKGSQWVILTRKHAEIIVKDDVVFPMFQQHCQRKSLPEFWRDRPVPADNSKEHNCIPDEHYVATLLAQKGLEGELTRRSLTHTSWDISSSKGRERQGWHPVTYKLADATPTLVQSIKIDLAVYNLNADEVSFKRVGSIYIIYMNSPLNGELDHMLEDIDNIYYETEYRREWCTSKGKPSPCFLFARKFTRPAAMRLLKMSALGVSQEASRNSFMR